jgi:phosphoglycolate phosphatase-like HAD superfamily hydrolase
MRLDGMIFDLDGTLTDTFDVCFLAFREALQPFTGQSFTDEQIMARFGPSEEGMFRRWVPDRWEDCLQVYLTAYEREHRRIGRTYPGVETALGLLKDSGIRLGVVTGKGPQSATISLAQLDLAAHFDRIETGSPEGNVKVRCIERIVTRWGVPPNRVAYLGDVVSDIEASRTVGAIPLAAAWDERADANALRSRNPLAVFHTVPQFIDWIRRTVEPRAPRPQPPEVDATSKPESPPRKPGD